MLTGQRCVDILCAQTNYERDWNLRKGFEGMRQNAVENLTLKHFRNESKAGHWAQRLLNLYRGGTKAWF